jgi:hypothetical protein
MYTIKFYSWINDEKGLSMTRDVPDWDEAKEALKGHRDSVLSCGWEVTLDLPHRWVGYTPEGRRWELVAERAA